MEWDIKRKLDTTFSYQNLLFNKGFIITNGSVLNLDCFPFYNNWNYCSIRGFKFLTHKDTHLFCVRNKNKVLFLIGHAYNPFDMQVSESDILNYMINLSDDDFWEYESTLTGVYIMGIITYDGKLVHWTDCAGMHISYYGTIYGNYYLTSHATLLGIVLNLKEDSFVTQLKNSRYYHLFGNVLPGDISPYTELKRVVPNHWYSSNGSKKRFYPFTPIQNCRTEKEYRIVLNETSKILRNSLAICAIKWNSKKIAISVTGGKDSGETLASAYDYYDSFDYFSYISKPEEAIDANAAHTICEHIGLKHRIVNIPNENAEVPGYDIVNDIIYINGGSTGYIRPNEVRKRCFLINDSNIDIEVKSWVNEIARAYWYKKYNKSIFPASPNGRYLASLYKVFLENRSLLHRTSCIFDKYIIDYLQPEDIALTGDWTTLWSWEFGFSAGEGVSLFAEHILAFDITIPFNNRKLISLMLKPKLEDRINDRLQKDIICVNNPEQASLNIDIVNAAHTSRRALMERIYLAINTRLPF